MNFTDERKAEKFNEILAEYQRLMVYRHNLAELVTSGMERVLEKIGGDAPGSHIYVPIVKKFDPDEIRKIQQEIVRIDLVTDFISSIIYEDGKTIESSINPHNILKDNENSH